MNCKPSASSEPPGNLYELYALVGEGAFPLSPPLPFLTSHSHSFASAALYRLTAPSVAATTDVTLGGSAVDDFGAWAPRPPETLPGERDAIVMVPAASAALVTLQGR
jgi:hypothetical protein